MAEGLARKILGSEVEIQSAGSEPSGKVHPFAIQAMKEIGIDIFSHRSKSWNDLPPNFFVGLDYVITLCAEEICPTIAVKAKRLHWGLPDPVVQGSIDSERLEAFRSIRDAIKQQLEEFRKG